MELKDQVVSLELSKRLKELGVNHESYFNWCDRFQSRVGAPEEIVEPHLIRGNAGWVSDVLAPAYTVAELGEMLSTKDNTNTIRCTNVYNQWGCDYESHRTFGNTEADARAKMLIYLIENKLITL